MGYDWLFREAAPRHMVHAIRAWGTREVVGREHNPVILDWAHLLPRGKAVFPSDEVAWCGLFVAHCLQAGGREAELPQHWYRAFDYHVKGALCGGGPMFGDVMVISRPGGHHVFFLIGETKTEYVGLGGNQGGLMPDGGRVPGNAVTVAAFAKTRLVACRRPLYRLPPTNVRRVELGKSGAPLSTSEA